MTKTFILLLFLSNDFVNSTCDDVAGLNFRLHLFLLAGIHELILWDYSNKSIFKTTYCFVVSNELGNSSCHNNTFFESSLRFIDQKIEEFLVLDHFSLIFIVSRIIEWCPELLEDVFDHYPHVTLACHVKLCVIGLGIQIVD